MEEEKIKKAILSYIYCDEDMKNIAILDKEKIKKILKVDEMKFEE